MKKLKTLLASCLAAGGLLSATATPLNIPDGWLDAKTSLHRGQQLQLTYYSVTPIGNGQSLVAFCIQGHGDWKCYETLPDFTRVFLGEGKATQTDKIQFVVMDSVAGEYCYFEFFNVHGYAGPQL